MDVKDIGLLIIVILQSFLIGMQVNEYIHFLDDRPERDKKARKLFKKGENRSDKGEDANQ